MSTVASTPRMRARRDFPAWIYITSFLLIALLSILPIIVTVVAVGVAQSYGCTISESNVNPCLIGGTDYGAMLQWTGNSFWMLLISMPAGFVLFVVWLIAFIAHLVIANRRRKAMPA
jgi:hypothetical protein